VTVFANVFTKTLRDQRKALAGWSIGLAVLVLLEAALWPTVRNMGDLGEFIQGYPEALRELFKIDEFASGAGFLNGELYSLMLPILNWCSVQRSAPGPPCISSGSPRPTTSTLSDTSPIVTCVVIRHRLRGIACRTRVARSRGGIRSRRFQAIR
jgi:hypothetical protein